MMTDLQNVPKSRASRGVQSHVPQELFFILTPKVPIPRGFGVILKIREETEETCMDPA